MSRRGFAIWAMICATMLPGFALAQTAATPQQNLIAPIQGQGNTTTLVITVKSSQSNRFLGDVQIKIGSKTFKVSDPPLRDGLQITGIPVGKIEVVAERKFYSRWDQSVTLSKKQYNEIEIKLSPLADVPKVDQSLTNTNMRNSYLPTNSWYGGSSSSVLNPLLNLGNFGNLGTIGNLAAQTFLNPNNSIFSGMGQTQSPLTYFSGQSIGNDLRNYSVKRVGNGDFYLVSDQNVQDARKIIFVDRGDGQGGIAFIPAGTTLDVNYNMQSESTWYVALYQVTADQSEPVKIDLTKTLKGNLSPFEYANNVKATIMTSNILAK